MEKKHILIIEDNVEFMTGIKELLELEGYNVSCAATGKEGMEIAFKELPDLITLDVMMENKTAGFDISREMRKIQELKNIPIIMVTGICSEFHLPFKFEPDESYLPVTRFLEKPIQPKILLEEIRNILAESEHKTDSPVQDNVIKKKALIIDDDPDFAESMKQILNAAGYNVINADTGANGYSKAIAEKPNLILLDVMMEDCSAGLDTVRKLRDDVDTAKIPVFMLTGIHKPEYLLGSFAEGEAFPNVKGVFHKPVEPERLVGAIEASVV